MDAARSRLDRAKQLFDKGLLPKADFDTTNSSYKVAEAKYEDSLEEARNRQALLAQRRSELELARQQLGDAVFGCADQRHDSTPKRECPVAYSLVDDLTAWLHTGTKASLAQRSLKSSM